MSARQVTLYVNLDRPPGGVLLAGRRDLTAAEPPLFVDGERPLVVLQFLQPLATPGLSPEVTQLADGDTIVLALKRRGKPELLVSGTGFVLTGAGAERRYEALVNFNTTALVNAFGDETVLPVLCEIRVQNAANTIRKVYPFYAQIQKRIYDGEGDPIEATPDYPTPDAVALRVPANGTYRVKTTGDGQYFQLKHRTTGLWHTVFVDGAEGAEALALGPAEA